MALAEAPFRLSETPSEAELVAKYFRALGEPTRLRILELLAEEDLSVGEIVERLGLPQPKVSNHLSLPPLVRVRSEPPRPPCRSLPHR
jgi:DNA-binding transcriptional ArsR family regulator